MTEEEQLVIQRVMAECRAAMAAIPGIPPQEARQLADDTIRKAYESACEQSNDIYTEGHGNKMLQRESSDEELHAAFEKRRAEGVTDYDIRWWWNMSIFEQEVIAQQDEFNRATLYIKLRQDGMEADDVAREVFKHHVRWGDPTEEHGEDRPLPYELKHRIVSYLEKNSRDPDGLKAKIASHSSFNALVRVEIKNGNL